MPHDTRDQVVDYLRDFATLTELPVTMLVDWLGIQRGKFYEWRKRYGKVNEHNAWVPREHWLEAWEKQAIIDFHDLHPLNGYRRLAFMMIDADVVAVSPSSVYRVLSTAGLLDRWNKKESKKGKGFGQPSKPHAHWHIDISYINVAGTFYYLCTVLDGASRAVLHWELKEAMTEADIELILERAREAYPGEKPRIISDNGPQFIAGDFKQFIRLTGMTHVRTSPYYPQSNGKLERWHKSIKTEAIRPAAPADYDDAIRVIGEYVDYYNNVRLHSAISYVTPATILAGDQQRVLDERDAKLAAARERRTLARRAEQQLAT